MKTKTLENIAEAIEVDEFNRFVYSEALWMDYPGIPTLYKYGNKGDVLEEKDYVLIDQAIKRGWAKHTRYNEK